MRNHFSFSSLLGACLALHAVTGCDSDDDAASSPDAVPGDGSGPFACTEATADCNGDESDGCEVSITDHAQHCGGCGLSCLGGQCVDGACQPYAVAPSDPPDDLITANGRAYLSSSWYGSIVEVPLAAGSEATYFDFGAYTYPRFLAAAGDRLVFTTDYDPSGGLFAVPFTGGGATRLPSYTYYFGDLAVGGETVVWTDYDHDQTLLTSLSGAEPAAVVASGGQGLAANATHVAWRRDGAIHVLDFAARGEAVVSTPSEDTSMPAIDAEHVYWVDGGTLRRWVIATGEIQPLASGLGVVERVATSRRHAYVQDPSGAVRAVPLEGGQVTLVATSAQSLYAGDDGATWVESGFLKHLAEPGLEATIEPTCGGSFSDCNGIAADGCETATWSDAAHCGTCGHVCDGPCVAGACQPLVLTGLPDIASTITAAGHVFVANYHAVERIAVDGSTRATVFDSDESISALATDGVDVYFGSDTGVWKVTGGTGTPVRIVDTYYPTDLVVGAASLYWVASADRIYQASKAGGAPIEVAGYLELDQVDVDFVGPLAEVGGQLYFAGRDYNGYGKVLRMGAPGTTPQTVYTPGYDYVTTLVGDAQMLVAGQSFEGGVHTLSPQGAITSSWDAGSGVTVMAEDASDVYWVSATYHADGGYTTHRLLRAAKAGGEVGVLVADLPDGASALAVDETHVYYADYAGLKRVSKAGL